MAVSAGDALFLPFYHLPYLVLILSDHASSPTPPLTYFYIYIEYAQGSACVFGLGGAGRVPQVCPDYMKLVLCRIPMKEDECVYPESLNTFKPFPWIHTWVT